jgi:hypothetical protein
MFMEMVAGNQITIDNEQAVAMSVLLAADLDTDYDFGGPESAVKFFEGLANKIKSGTIDLSKDSGVAEDIARELLSDEFAEGYNPETLNTDPASWSLYGANLIGEVDIAEDQSAPEEGEEVNPKDDKPIFDKLATGKKNKRLTKKEWDNGGADAAIAVLYSDGKLEKYIKAKMRRYQTLPGFDFSQIFSAALVNVMEHIRRFDPEVNDSLYGWTMNTINFEVLDAVKDITKTDLGFTEDIDADDSFTQLEDVDAAEAMDNIEVIISEEKKKGTPFVDVIFAVNGVNKADVKEAIFAKVRTELGLNLHKFDVASPEFAVSIQKAARQAFRDMIKATIGTPGSKTYKAWLANYGEQIYNLIPQSTFNTSFGDFIVNNGRMSVDASVTNRVKNVHAGNDIFTKKPFDLEAWIDYHLNPVKGTKDTKQKQLIEALSIELFKDAVFPVIKAEGTNEHSNIELKTAEIGELAALIERDPDAKWSKAWRGFDLVQRGIISTMFSDIVAPKLKTAFTADEYENIMLQTFQGIYIDGKKAFKPAELKRLGQDIHKILDMYDIEVSTATIGDISSIIETRLSESEMELVYFKEMGLDPKYKDAAHLASDQNQIDKQIALTVGFIKNLVTKHKGNKGAALLEFLKWHRGHLTGAGKISRGEFAQEEGGIYTTRVNDGLNSKGKLRTQRFMWVESMSHLLDIASEALDISRAELEAMLVKDKGGSITHVKVNGENISASTPSQTIARGRKISWDESKKAAREGWESMMDLLLYYKDNATKEEFVHLMYALKGDMRTVLKSSAPVKYVSQDAKPDDRYEHLVPTMAMVFALTDYVLNPNSTIDIDMLQEEYNVAIIPDDMDTLVNVFYQSTMPAGWLKALERYYNGFTRNNAATVPLKDKSTGEIVGNDFVAEPASWSKTTDAAASQVVKKLTSPNFVYKDNSGASLFDLDDTVREGDEKTWYVKPNPNGDPRPDNKIIYLVGGAGSGKSNVIAKLGLADKGFVIINPDTHYEALLAEAGLPTDQKQDTAEQRSQRLSTL